jgi:hypothetical protein
MAQLEISMIDPRHYYIVNVDDKQVVSKGYVFEDDADEAACNLYGEDYWTNATPFAVWYGANILKSNFTDGV